ncbi:MAG TPA: SnoaL-like domain-containing protein [Cyclobacteriaceae bacterium]|nr:SnoaL-like domain-containing protein [Cyclobacteriaceae bacterium]
MNTLKEKITELNSLVLSGKALDAFEKFYHNDVVMQENEGAPTIGKAANRQREMEFFANITDFRGAEVKALAVGDNVTTVVWSYDYTHKQWGVRKYTQASVQHWKDGLIVREQFFYGS